MEEIDIPHYFICPISLQIMNDPVITVSGMTYDRKSIEHWLSTTNDATCPITKQPMTSDSDLTPNHTLRRLIQAWCVANAKFGVDRIPTPKCPLEKSIVLKLIREVHNPLVCVKALNKLMELAKDNEKNKACMTEAGVIKSMFLFVTRISDEGRINGLEEALSIINLIWSPTNDVKQMVIKDGNKILQSLLWVLRFHSEISVKTQALLVIKLIIGVASSALLDRLELDFHQEILKMIEIRNLKKNAKTALQILIDVCPWGRNRMKMIELGAVFNLIDLELNNDTQKNMTELTFCLLAHLCSCADGRAQLLKHGGGIAMVAKRILRVSCATDDRAIHILTLIARFSATKETLKEMLSLGAVSKLCMVLQANCTKSLKDKAREVLKLHSNVWNNSSCLAVYLQTKDPR